MIVISEEIKIMKSKCHEVFDEYWRSNIRKPNSKKHINAIRKYAYHRLAGAMRTDAYQCHFSKMNDLGTLQEAYDIIIGWDSWK